MARDEAKIARTVAKELAPDYHQPGTSTKVLGQLTNLNSGLDYLRHAKGYNVDFDNHHDGEEFQVRHPSFKQYTIL